MLSCRTQLLAVAREVDRVALDPVEHSFRQHDVLACGGRQVGEEQLHTTSHRRRLEHLAAIDVQLPTASAGSWCRSGTRTMPRRNTSAANGLPDYAAMEICCLNVADWLDAVVRISYHSEAAAGRRPDLTAAAATRPKLLELYASRGLRISVTPELKTKVVLDYFSHPAPGC